MQKITVSLILWKYRPNKNGEFSIYLRFGSGAKAKLTKTGYTCRESDWDKNKCRVKGTLTNSGIINADLNRQLNKSLDAIGEIKNDYSQNNLETVKEIVKADSIDTNFYNYTETKIEFLKAKYSRFTILNLKSLNIKFNNYAI